MNLLDLMVTIRVDDGDVEEKLGEIGQQAQGAAGQIGAADIAIGNMIADIARWGANAMKQMAQTGVQYNAQIETYTAALTTALGNEAAAAAAIEQIKVDAAKTPYSVDGLTKANTYLIQAGESAESARETILALTDAISASGGGNDELQRMAQNLQQIKNTGQATAMDIRQFAMAGIDIYGILADYTGKSTEEVRGLKISYEMLTGALKQAAEEGGKYFEANLRQSETLNGQLSTLADNWQNTLGNAFSGLSETLSGDILPAMNEFLESLGPEGATALLAGLTVEVVAFGGAAIASSKSAMAFVTALKGIVANPAFLMLTGITAGVVAGTAAFHGYTNELTETDGTVEGLTTRLEELKTKEAELKAQMDSGWGTEQTQSEYDATRLAISRVTEELEKAKAAEAEVETAAEGTTDALSEQETRLQNLATAYVEAFTAAKAEVQSWFGMFQQADQVTAASLEQMAANVQSQIDFNTQYQASLENLSQNGYGALAEQIAYMGTDGAQYALALSEALTAGNTAQVDAIVGLLGTLEESQNGLATSITTVGGQYDELIEKIADGTADPYTLMIEADNSNALAGIDAASAAADALNGKISTIYIQTVDLGVTGGSADGHPAYGMDYVPFDGFVASLHKGERVMTAAENRAFSQGRTQAPAAQPIVLNATLELDGETVAYKTFRFTQGISQDRGTAFVKE